MNTFFASTKLNTPQSRSNFVPRPRLVDKLIQGLQHKFILVSAPPGFGKTSLVAAWINSLMVPEGTQASVGPYFAWDSLDETDDDPVQFFACLAACFQKIEPSLAQSIHPLLTSPEPIRPEVLMATLINDLAGCQKSIYLIMDDYHCVHREEIHRAMQYLIEHQPANLRLVLLSREDPPLPLSRLRVRGEITEIREADLRFTQEEAQVFFNQILAFELSPDSVQKLESRTEGWIAGLQLAALAFQAFPDVHRQTDIEEFVTAFGGDDRFVMDYLMDEVFRRQPPHVQRFLLSLSILDRFCASLCSAMIGDGSQTSFHDSQQALEMLERANLFVISLDNRREWYRFHRLFGDFLKHRLQSEYPDLSPVLHRRAGHWFAQMGDADEAIRHALAVPDVSMAASIADEHALSMIGNSLIGPFLRWIQAIPLTEVSQHARLCVGGGWASVLTGRLELVDRYVAAGEIALERYESTFSRVEGRWITSEELRGHLAAIRAYAERLKGNLSQALAFIQQALLELPTDALNLRSVVTLTQGLLLQAKHDLDAASHAFSEALELALKSEENMYVALSALALMGGIAASQGKLNQAAQAYQRAIHLGTTASGSTIPLPAVGYAHGGMVAVLYLRNEIAEAEEQIRQALALVELIGSKDTLGEAYVYQALLAIERSQFDQAENLLNKVQEFAQAHLLGDAVRSDWLAARIHLWLTLGDAGSAISWVKALGLLPAQPESWQEWINEKGCCSPSDQPLYLLLARLWIAQGETDLARRLVDRIRSRAQEDQNQAILLEIYIIESVLAQKRSEALSWLEKALNAAAPEGNLRPFLNAGEPMIELLRQALIAGCQPAFTQKLLSDLIAQENRLVRVRKGSASQLRTIGEETVLVESLTEREHQVLRLLAAGLSSREAAAEMVISVSTVRSYIKTLYQKLDAHNRDEAIEKSRRLGFL